ncbi:MAG: hypothetical protein IJE82_00380, partial [Alphaproteobacteria bacterium]|nr:hypothetical protein [Alphaproteobacteria bacterium]
MPNLNVGLGLAMVVCANANATCCVGLKTDYFCSEHNGVSCTKVASYETCTSCAYGCTSGQRLAGTLKPDNIPVYALECNGTPDDGDEPSSSDTIIISMSSVGATTYRIYGFYASINDDDGNADGILSDDLPLLPMDEDDNFIFQPVCYGTNRYPTNGIAPECTFDMDKYMEYYENEGTYPGDFDELVSNCTGCSTCSPSCAYYQVGDSPYKQYGCYEYQDVPGNYCPFVPTGDYRCTNGYYGVVSYSNN